MKQQIQISAKNLGALALPDFCPKCFWIRMKCRDRLPFFNFPGIFSSIDSYSKKITAAHFHLHGRSPRWFDGFGELGVPIAVPGWRKFQLIDHATNIILSGVPDEILYHAERGLWIVDYKTARYTGNQDALAPMYEIQLNCYALIAAEIGLGSVCGLGLLYYEPITEINAADSASLIEDNSFFLEFSPKLKSVKLDTSRIPPLLQQVRNICDAQECPTGKLGCTDCTKLELLASTVSRSNS
ncbi:MAG TPA: PD-(D/E)XK nuclease family protein [Candidatus Angelobacter sp.]|nr:PD-(D/E)XK nuclease family protein [Candidatus Angelobacter sp.]